MGKVEQFLKETRYTLTLGGVDFELRRPNQQIGLRVYGHKLLGMIAAINVAEMRQKYADNTTEQEREKHIREILRLCMISPALGSETDSEADAISFDDLDMAIVPDDGRTYARAIWDDLIGADSLDFTESSEDQTGGDSPPTSTPSDSDTDIAPAS